MIDAQHRCDVGFIVGYLFLFAFMIRHRMFLIHIGEYVGHEIGASAHLDLGGAAVDE